MKETGMVRRLDDLGRLVIPKEIRKMYKMKEGDSIEIYIKEGNIIIRKFDETSEFYDQINKICELLQNKYQNTFFFTSEEYIARNQLEIEEKVLEKTTIHRSSFIESCKVFKNQDELYDVYVSPIVYHGNYFGSLVQVFNKAKYIEDDLEVMNLFAQLLANQQHD